MKTASHRARRVEELLEQLRPYLETDGVQCFCDRVEDDTVFLRMESTFVGCPSVLMTIRMGLERRIVEEMPEIGAVEFL